MAKFIYTDEACSEQVNYRRLSIPSLMMLASVAPPPVAQAAPTPQSPGPQPLEVPDMVEMVAMTALGQAGPQAAALIRAAQSGAPFCEQCARMS